MALDPDFFFGFDMTFGKRKAGTQKRQAFVKLHSFSKGQDVSFQFCYIFNSSKIGLTKNCGKTQGENLPISCSAHDVSRPLEAGSHSMKTSELV